ncbi:MAG: hypothetical protein ACM3II_06650 [Rhodospirillaceae bacterium]
MSFMQLLSSIVLPVAMAFGAIAAWRMQKREPRSEDGRPAWRDDSLDDWRKQRDQEADVRRQEREEQSLSGAVAEEQAERKRHQRIGG